MCSSSSVKFCFVMTVILIIIIKQEAQSHASAANTNLQQTPQLAQQTLAAAATACTIPHRLPRMHASKRSCCNAPPLHVAPAPRPLPPRQGLEEGGEGEGGGGGGGGSGGRVEERREERISRGRVCGALLLLSSCKSKDKSM